MPGLAAAAGLTVPPTQTYMLGFGGGPRRPTVPTAGLKGVPAAALFVARFHRAEVALKVIGIVEPGSAWMFVNVAGSVKVMITKALALPVICQAPAVAAVGCTVVEILLMTVPKSKSRNVVIVIPTVTTTASAVTEAEGVCACNDPAPHRSSSMIAIRFTARPAA